MEDNKGQCCINKEEKVTIYSPLSGPNLSDSAMKVMQTISLPLLCIIGNPGGRTLTISFFSAITSIRWVGGNSFVSNMDTCHFL